MTWTSIAFVCLAAAAAYTAQDKPSAESRPASRPAFVFPTFEPFFKEPMAKMMAPGPSPDIRVFVRAIAQRKSNAGLADLLAGKGKDPLAGLGSLPRTPAESSSRPSAKLVQKETGDRKEIVRRLWFMRLPTAVAFLDKVWDENKWDEADVDLASASAEYIAMGGGPKFEFAKGEVAKNRQQLEALGNWYVGETRKPTSYASMIATMDDGPFVGLPYETKAPLPDATVQKLDDETELRWAQVKREDEPWVVQCVHRGIPIWARVISSEPHPSVDSVSVGEGGVEPLGAYGWRINFGVHWSGGHERAHLYVGADRSFLFYYMSW